jgi:signal transduction histidine kinase
VTPRTFLRKSVSRKVAALVVATTLAALFLTAVALTYYTVRDYSVRKLGDMRTQAEIVARASAPALDFNDAKEANRDLALLKARPGFVQAVLYTPDGKVFAAYVRDGDRSKIPESPGPPGHRIEDGTITLVYPIVEDGKPIGTLLVKSLYEVRRRLYAYLLIMGIVMTGAMIASLVLFAQLQKKVTQPILRLADAARAVIERRDFSIRAGKTTDDEIGVLADAMNGMLADLEQEIAERRAAEEALREVDRRKDEFLATLAHELRNPLAPIRNSLYLLRMANTDASTQARAHEIIERQVQQMVRLVDDLLEVSRITTGKLELKREPVDLRKIATAALEAVEPVVRERHHRLEVKLPPPDMIIDADPIRLAQVFLNLLNNAAKFTHPGGHIQFILEVRNGEMIATVRDDGVGIAPDMIESMFEMFAQADRSLEKTTAGLGVGLSLSRRLVELHGGTIEAYSAGAGKGSEFTVRMPARAA